MKKAIFTIWTMVLCSTMSWGETWSLSSTMKATLDNAGVLTITTTAAKEAMPDFIYVNQAPPWWNVRADIQSVVIGDNVISVGYNAFYQCNKFSSVTFPESLTRIEESAFYYTALTIVAIPKSVEFISVDAFWRCRMLNSIHVAEENTKYSSVHGVLYDKDTTTLIFCPAGKSGSFVIPASVTTIEEYAFFDCMQISAIIIPNSVTEFGKYAFHECFGLKDIFVSWPMPLPVQSNAEPFLDLTGLRLHVPMEAWELYEADPYWGNGFAITSFRSNSWELTATMTATLHSGVLTFSTTADEEAMPDFFSFPYQMSLTYFTNDIFAVAFEEGITAIGKFNEGYPNFTSVTIANSVTKIGDEAFSSCGSLTSVTIPDAVTVIGNFAFSRCVSLTSVIIPKAVTEIGREAFYFCQSLTSVTIPNSVKMIGDMAFTACDSLKDMTVAWDTPLSVSDNIFRNYLGRYYVSNATLHVPTGTKARYQTANAWKEFGTIVEYAVNPTGIEPIKAESKTLNVYASNGVIYIRGLQPGHLLTVYSISGQLIYKGVAKSETEQISVKEYGIYIIATENQVIKALVR